uniref:Uncharacterized protein n=1 Tax=Panagrolaimus davidi TaxID=227884 RepID=A0A914Q737_9BILA
MNEYVFHLPKEYDQKLQTLRQEFEDSLLTGTRGETAKNAIQQAENIIATEYQGRIDALTTENEGLRAENQNIKDYEKQITNLNAELEALRSEIKQYNDEKLDLAEQKEIDEDYQKKCDGMETFYMNEMKRQADTIKDLRKLVTAEFSEDFDGRNLSAKEILMERLKISLKILDSEWGKNNVLRGEIEKIINGGEDGTDTVSQLHENLANEHQRIRVDSYSSTSSDNAQNISIQDVPGALNIISNLRKMIRPLIFHLKKLPQYLEGVQGIPESEEFHELLRKISNMTFDLDATINDVEEFERTINPTLQQQINLKWQIEKDLNAAKEEVTKLALRVEENVDEKITLQADLKDLEEDYNEMKKLYDLARDNSNVEKLSKALRVAKASVKAKSNALAETASELETAKRQITEIMDAYSQLREENQHLNNVLEEWTEEVNLLIEEIEKIKDQQSRFAENEKKLIFHQDYLKAICEKVFNNNPRTECPPIVTAQVHQYLMD